MKSDLGRRLTGLAEEIEARWPGVVVGWDLGLGPLQPEDGDIALEVFSLADEEEREFLAAVLPLIRRAEGELRLSILLLPHTAEATRQLYADVPERIKARRSALRPWSLTLELARHRASQSPRAA